MSFFYVMVAASVSRGHGHTPDATIGVKQRPAAAAAAATTTAAATTASAGGYRFNRLFRRQSHAISRAIANQLQPAHRAVGIAATLEPPQQLNQTTLFNASRKSTDIYESHFSFRLFPPIVRRRFYYTCATNALSCGAAHTHRSLLLSILSRDNVSQLRKQRKKN